MSLEPLRPVTPEDAPPSPRREREPRIGPHHLDDPLARATHIRSVALTVLAILAALFAIYFTRSLLLPIFVAILLQFILSPVVRLLGRAKIPAPVGAGLVLLLLLGTFGYGVFRLTGPALEWTRNLPDSLQQVERKIAQLLEPVAEVTKATEQVENITKVNGSEERNVVTVEEPTLSDTLFLGLREFAAGAVLATILLYFLLASGDSFLRKLVGMLPRLSGHRAAVDTIRAIQSRISTYLLTITVINTLLGFAVGFTLYLLGLPNAVLWGVMAGLLNFVPYLGAVIGVSVVAVVALLSFDSLGQAAAAPGLYLLLTSVEGMIITPMVLGLRLTLSPVAIFLWLLLWNWLWGFPGALIAVPMLVTLKIFCDNVPALSTLGRFLGR